MSSEAVRKRRQRLGAKKQVTTIEQDLTLLRLNNSKKETDKKYKSLLNRIASIEAERDAAVHLNKVNPSHIHTIKSENKSEATAVILASDWHIEERVVSSTVSGLNRFDLNVAKQRVETFWRTSAKMVNMFKRDIPIPNILLWLGGDMISGNIHDELLETAQLPPIEAAITAQDWIAGGIEYLLDHTTCKITVVCNVGNHSRITKERRVATEIGNSLELFMYSALANHFKNHKRIEFILPEGYHTYVNVYNYKCRFHHGHAIKYSGGIGSIFISGYKAISQWNKARPVDYDFWGHYHSQKDGGNFVQNGSIIGYNAFALSVKADFETPRQMFILIDKNRGKTLTCPIIC